MDTPMAEVLLFAGTVAALAVLTALVVDWIAAPRPVMLPDPLDDAVQDQRWDVWDEARRITEQAADGGA